MSESRTQVSGRSSVPQARSGRKSPVIVIRATNDLPEQFQEIVAIDDIEYLTQAISLTSLFNGAIDNQTGRFNPAKARELIEAFNNDLPPENAAYKIGIFNTYQSTLTQTNSVVSGMIGKILDALKNAVGVALGTTTVEQLTASITDAFTDLKTQEGDAWIFWQQRQGNKTTYSYAILFAIQDATTGRLMFALPMSMEIEVEVAYEKVLFITLEDKETYSVKLDVMRVGQILYPKSPASASTRASIARSAMMVVPPSIGDPATVDEAVSSIVVENWAKSKKFATAATGRYSRNGVLEQIITADANVSAQLIEGSDYLVSFVDGNSVRQKRNLRFNGEVGEPAGALWFVSQ